MMSPDERLVYMANQIARNFAAQGETVAISSTADHLEAFWEARMLARVAELRDALDPIAAAALSMLETRGAPEPQTLATTSGGSDAG